ncbi:murein hydrolase transporter LrgA [Pasteurellaceae bacterium RH1A]|nr:murein hydrolase transporter LrgA [Pasteurellaceae bacterium RH1A]
MLNKLKQLTLALAILWGMLYLGKGLAWLLPIGIADSIWGLLILFICLLAGLIKAEWISPVALPFNRYMAIFFLPICAGIIEHGDLFVSHVDSFFLAAFVSSVISIVGVGLFAQKLLTKKEKQDD